MADILPDDLEEKVEAFLEQNKQKPTDNEQQSRLKRIAPIIPNM